MILNHRLSLITFLIILLGSIVIFWVISFDAGRTHRYSYEDTYWQRPTSTDDFPFSIGSLESPLQGIPTGVSPLATPFPSLTAIPTTTPSPTPTPTPTVGPTVTLSPVLSTATDPELQAEHLLEAYPQEFCPERTTVIECMAPLQIKILDFLHSNPDSPRRQALLDRIIVDPRLYPWKVLHWLKEDWLAETIGEPFNNSNGLPPGFKERWQSWGQFFTTDLDNNGEPDYLLALPLTDRCPQDGELYWVHRVGNSHQIHQLPTTFDYSNEESIYPAILAIKDLNGDGRDEVAYTVSTCGATIISKLRVLTWQENQFKDLLVGSWTPSNGEWKIEDEDGDGFYELRGRDTGPGNAGYGPFLAYELSFNLSHGEYIPTEQTALAKPDTWPKSQDVELLYWQWAGQLFQTGSFTRSLEIYKSFADGQIFSPDGWVEFRPYALFYQGVTRVLLDNTIEAHRIWGQLTAEFPQHPVGQTAAGLSKVFRTKDDIWKACGWLYGKSQDWSDPRWAASESAVNYTKWQLDTGGTGDYQKWLAAQGEIDYTRERQILDIFIPDYYFFHLQAHGLCQPVFLMGLHQWSLDIPLAKQFATLGVEWEELSTGYDLNQDGRVDPIGLLNINDKRYLWAFLSQERLYEPLSVTQPYPVDAIDVWQGATYIQGHEIWTDDKVSITDLDNNGMAEVLLPYPGGINLWEWVGHRFQFHNVYYPSRYYEQQYRNLDADVTFVPLPGGTTGIKSRVYFYDFPEQTLEECTYRLSQGSLEQVEFRSFSSPSEIELLGQAAEALFRQNEPQTALKLLDDYNAANLPDYYPSRHWYEAAGLYLKALALQYSGSEAEAWSVFSTLAQDFSGTGWSLLAREKLQSRSN